jgi:hypothetical protein
MPVYEVEYRSEYSGIGSYNKNYYYADCPEDAVVKWRIENKDTAYASHRFIAVVLHKQAHKCRRAD